MSQIGKRITELVNGIPFPGIVVGPSTFERVTLASGREITVERADCVSLRTTNPANGDVVEFLAFSNENLNPRFSPPRFDYVHGLDVNEHGELIGLDAITKLATASAIAFQQARLAASQPAVLVLDEEPAVETPAEPKGRRARAAASA